MNFATSYDHHCAGFRPVVQGHSPQYVSLGKDLSTANGMKYKVFGEGTGSGGEADIWAATPKKDTFKEVDESMEMAATKLQAAFLGYSVRRRKPLIHLRKIAAVKRKLKRLQLQTADPVYIEKVCVDAMECRKLTEDTMALLLQLDALQDVHPVVRDIRKGVNREVVQFMEVIDAVVVGAASSPWRHSWNNPSIVRSSSNSNIDIRAISTGFAGDRETKSQAHTSSHKETDRSEFASAKFDESQSAVLLIQSRFRGYRVRRTRPLKHLRNIADVKSKLKELSIQMSSAGYPGKLRSDHVERLKFLEKITALLLQLDSVQGVDYVVRDIRKSVTRDVFKLQEAVDALISEADTFEDSSLSVGCGEIMQERGRLGEFTGLVSATTSVRKKKNVSFADGFEAEVLGTNQVSEVGAAALGNKCSWRVHDQQTVTSVTLNPDSSALKIPAQEVHCEENVDIKLGNKLSHENSPEWEFEIRNVPERLKRISGTTAVDKFESHRDESRPSGIVERDLIFEKFNFIPNTPAGPTSTLGKSISASNTCNRYEASHLLLREPHIERSTCSDVQHFCNLPYQPTRVTGGKFFEENRKPGWGVAEPDHYKETCNLLQRRFQYSAPAEKPEEHACEGVETCQLLTEARGVHQNLAPERSSGKDESRVFMDIRGLSSSPLVENTNHHNIKNMDFVHQLAEENIKLITLLNDVLIFAEMQSSRISRVKGRLGKLEGEVMQYKKRENIWPRRSKTSRRR